MYRPKKRTVECAHCGGDTLVDVGAASRDVTERRTHEGELTREGLTRCDQCDELFGFDPESLDSYVV